MGDNVELDLFIQDFIISNKLAGHHISWSELVNRQFAEGCKKIFSFQSGGVVHYAQAEYLLLPDEDVLRIHLSPPKLPIGVEHRFDCLRMTQSSTHTGITVTTLFDSVCVMLSTKHKGFIHVVFVLNTHAIKHPLLC
jgi:hypothetical protein